MKGKRWQNVAVAAELLGDEGKLCVKCKIRVGLLVLCVILKITILTFIFLKVFK